MSLFSVFQWFLVAGKEPGALHLHRFATNSQGQVYPAEQVKLRFLRPNSAEDSAKSGATVIDAGGNIVELAEDVPAWSFPIGGSPTGCAKLTLSPQVKNLLPAVLDFTAWSTLRITIEPSNVLAPDGQTLAKKFQETTGSGQHYGRYTLVIGQDQYARAIFAKAGERTSFILATVGGDILPSGTFDLAQETVSLGSNTTDGGVIAYPNGWYLCYVIGDGDGSVDNEVLLINENGDFNYSGDGESGMYFFLPNLQQASVLTPLIPGNITRSAPSIQEPLTGLQEARIFGDPDLSFYLDLDFWRDGGSDADLIVFKDVDDNPIYSIRAISGVGLKLYDVGSSTLLGGGLSPDAAGSVAFTYDNQTLRFYVRGELDGSLEVQGNRAIDKMLITPGSSMFRLGSKNMGFGSKAVTAQEIQNELSL